MPNFRRAIVFTSVAIYLSSSLGFAQITATDESAQVDSPASVQSSLTFNDILRMVEAGLAEDLIVFQILTHP